MPVTNGKEVANLLEEATEKHPGLTETTIAERTAELGAPFGEVSARTLGRAKSNANIKKGNLLSLAEIFSQLLGREVPYESLIADAGIVGSEEDETGEAQPVPLVKKKMIAKSKKNAPAVNAEEGATVSINIGVTPKD